MSLTTNTATLQSILDTVNALPEAGSGGGSVETCTVTITENSGTSLYYFLTTYTDGAYDYKSYYVPGNIIIADVVCGSLITFVYGTPIPGISLSENMEKVIETYGLPGASYAFGITAPKTAGETGQVAFTDLD